MEDKYLTVKELVAILSEYPPEMEVGVRAGCCCHLHEFIVRMRGENETFPEYTDRLVLDAS